ncbi:tRNA pseudouridine(55) synthase TruB [Magnetospira thiophila]
MGRKRRGEPIHGWLIIDKPLGMTSNAVVGQVRRLTNAAKVGHGGTLDPLASGVLPLALGEATKTVSYVMDGTKIYHFTIRWGIERSTDDAEGEITRTSDKRPTEAEIHQALKGFIGTIAQVPPKFSAVKVEGQRAYALARADKEVELSSRPVRIDRFQLLEMIDDDHAAFEVESGKGAYMRSLARDLALAVGTVGHVARLRRISVGAFTEETAISLDKLAELGHSAALEDYLLAVETALDDIPALALTEPEARRLRNGQPVSLLAVARRSPQTSFTQGAMVCAMAEGKPVALARIEGGEVRPVRVLNI